VFPDPCRLVRQVKQFGGLSERENFFTCRTSRQGSREGCVSDLAAELLHLPDKPAGA
jgi:hypothetical protein